MTTTQVLPWKRITVEAAAIVASILLAFSIDAWWQERIERGDESEQLDRMRAEFSQNIERIDQHYGQAGIDASYETGGMRMWEPSSLLFGR